MIQISTDAVYKDTNDNLHKEESEVSPVNIYGQTKLNGEKPVLKYKKELCLEQIYMDLIFKINVALESGY